MKKYFFEIEEEFIGNIPRLIEKFNGKKLIISLIQESRELESLYDIDEYIIYDNSDVLTGIISLEDAIINVEDNLDLLPSSYKKKVDFINHEIFENEIFKDYDYVFFLLDDIINHDLNNETIPICDSPKANKNNIICSKFEVKLVQHNKIYGFLNDNENDLVQLHENLENDKILDYNDFSFFQKIKGFLN